MFDRLRSSTWFWVGVLVAVQGVLVAAALALQRSSAPILYTDEMGYLGAAVELADQGDPFFGRSNKYAIGYSVIVSLPLRLVGGDAWEVAVGVNVAAALVLPVLLFLLVRRVSDLGKGGAALISAVAAAYPAVALHAPRAWPETVLPTLVAAWALLLLVTLRRRTPLWALALGGFSGAVYVVHHRTIALGVVATLVLASLVVRPGPAGRRPALLGAGLGIVAMVTIVLGGSALETEMYERIYSNTSDRAADRVMQGFLPGNWWTTGKAAIGQFWYLQTATFGAVGLAGIAAWWALRGRWRDRVWLWAVCLAALGTIAVAASSVRNGWRADYFVYGRYPEIFAPLLIAAGLAFVSRHGPSLRSRAATWSVLTIAPLTVAIGVIRGFDVWTRNFQKANLYGIMGLDTVAGDRGSPVTLTLDVFVIALASITAATVALLFVRRAPAWAAVALGASLVASTMAAAHWSLRPWVDIFERTSIEAEGIIEPEGEYGVVIGREGAIPRFETLNSLNYRTGFATVVQVEDDACPEVRYVVAGEAWAPDYPIRVATTLTPFGGVVYEVDCA